MVGFRSLSHYWPQLNDRCIVSILDGTSMFNKGYDARRKEKNRYGFPSCVVIIQYPSRPFCMTLYYFHLIKKNILFTFLMIPSLFPSISSYYFFLKQILLQIVLPPYTRISNQNARSFVSKHHWHRSKGMVF